jgi:hypothetical protein
VITPKISETPRHRADAAKIPANGICRDCASFSSSAPQLERAFPGLSAMGSGYGSVRWGDGLCAEHGRYLSCASSCKQFSPRQ